jgi:glycosyltransferase involved in cell wall biosynthesis
LEMKMKGKPYVSVVMPCYNARKTISTSLRAISKQDTDFDYEVVVADSSDDGTEKIIAGEFPQVRLIHLDRLECPGSKRNLGVRHAKGELIVFTDSDCVPPTDWLASIVREYNKVNADGIGGCVINGYPGILGSWVSHLLEFSEWTERTPEGYVRNNPTCNLSFKRDVFSKYNVCFTDVICTEDTLFNWTLCEKGGRIYFSPRVRTVHMKKVKMKDLIRYQVVMGKAAAEARRISTLPGKIFTRYPMLCLGLPFIRWARAVVRFARNDLKILPLFLLLTPFYLAATEAWTVGFMTRKDFPPPSYRVEGPLFDNV